MGVRAFEAELVFVPQERTARVRSVTFNTSVLARVEYIGCIAAALDPRHTVVSSSAALGGGINAQLRLLWLPLAGAITYPAAYGRKRMWAGLRPQWTLHYGGCEPPSRVLRLPGSPRSTHSARGGQASRLSLFPGLSSALPRRLGEGMPIRRTRLTARDAT
jgi:hypothetical protein